MRITSTMLYDQFNRYLQQNMTDLSVIQNRIASGKKIDKPSDDIVGMSRVMDYRLAITRNDQYMRNMDNATAQLELTDTTLATVNTTLVRAKELALQAVNGTQTAADRAIIANEMKSLRDQLAGLGNTRLEDKYIFSGFQTTRKAFELNISGEYAYQGDSNNININVAKDANIKENVTGDVAFSDPTKVFSATLGTTVGTGTFSLKVGSGNPMSIVVDINNNTPEKLRDTLNAPMSKLYNPAVPDLVGTGTLTLKAGTGNAVSLTVDATNNTPVLLAAAVNALGMGIEARLATDTVTGQQRLLFRPSTSGESISIDVADSDGNNTDTNGLSALAYNAVTKNLTDNALGIDAAVINGTAGKRMLFEPLTKGTNIAITVVDADLNNTDVAGLSVFYHNPPAGTNLNSSLSFFAGFDHMINSLLNNDTAGIKASLNLFDSAANQALNVSAEVGSRLGYLMAERQNNSDNNLNIKTYLSQTEDADVAQSASELARTEVALQAMMKSASQIMAQSLFSFLK